MGLAAREDCQQKVRRVRGMRQAWRPYLTTPWHNLVWPAQVPLYRLANERANVLFVHMSSRDGQVLTANPPCPLSR